MTKTPLENEIHSSNVTIDRYANRYSLTRHIKSIDSYQKEKFERKILH